jgi:hypothetical protein
MRRQASATWIGCGAFSLCVALMLVGLISGAQATSRGISVELRATARADAPVVETVQLYAKSYALVVGNDTYTDGWGRLSQARKDARLIARALRARGFDVTLKLDLDAKAMEKAFEDFFLEKGADPEARLFVWYAGHGHTMDKEGYLVPTDGPLPTNRLGFLRKAVSLRDFGKFMRLARSKHVFTIFDSCFAGTIFNVARAAPPPAITRVTAEAVRQFMTSGDAGQKVSDDGTFAKMFVDTLAGKRPADANGDGYLTASELGLHLTDAMSNYTRNAQTPRHGKMRDPELNKGDFVFKLASLDVGPVASGSNNAEIVFWQSIQASTNPASFEAYLSQYSNGSFAALARLRIAELKSQKTASLTPPPPTYEPKPEPKPEPKASAPPAENRDTNGDGAHKRGLLHYKGKGVPKDFRTAAEWFSKAAAKGHPGAQYNLGIMAYLGQGTKQDFAEAAKWFQRAGEQGHAASQYNLGFLFYEGKGVKKDNLQAYTWIDRAANQGHKKAKTARDALAKALPKEPSQNKTNLATPSPRSGARITVRATANSWIEVRDDFSNTILMSRQLSEGEVYRVPDQPGLSLHTGNAGVLEISVDGATVPAIGADGDVRRGVQLAPDMLRAGTAVR